MNRTTRSLVVAAALLSLTASAGGRLLADPPERETPGPVRFMLEVEVLDPGGDHVVLDGGTFDTQAQAVVEVERVTRDGICVSPELPPDPGIAATCYPPGRQLRTSVHRVWLYR